MKTTDKKMVVLNEGTKTLNEEEAKERHGQAGERWTQVGKEIAAGSNDVRSLMIIARNLEPEKSDGDLRFEIDSTCDVEAWWDLLSLFIAANPHRLMAILEAAGGVAVPVPLNSVRQTSQAAVAATASLCQDPDCPVHGKSKSKVKSDAPPKYQA